MNTMAELAAFETIIIMDGLDSRLSQWQMEEETEEQLKKKTASNGEQPPRMGHNKEGWTIIECILQEVLFEFDN